MSKSFLELTNEEKNEILPVVVNMLKHRKNPSKVFSNTEIREVLLNFDLSVTDAQIRKIVFYIRNNNLIPLLLANTYGYYVGTRIEDVRNWITMQEGKINAMNQTLTSIREQLDKKRTELLNGESENFGGQITIFDFE